MDRKQPQVTDAELLHEAKRDPTAFRVLYERHVDSIHGFVLNRTRDEEAAVDLTAETFAQAWLVRRRFRDEAGGSAAPWLFGIARNLIAQAVRRRRIELAACTKLGVMERLDRVRAQAEPDERWLEGIDEALAELPDGQRAAVELRVVHELDYDEIAAWLDTSPGAARVRVARGLGELRQRYDNDRKEAI